MALTLGCLPRAAAVGHTGVLAVCLGGAAVSGSVRQPLPHCWSPLLLCLLTCCPCTGTVDLHHTPEDKAAHIRSYLKPTMEVTKCHEDVQQGGGTGSHNGAILRYVATYDMKFSSSVDTEWLSGGGSDYSAAVGTAPAARAGARNVAHLGTGAFSSSKAERQHP